MGLVMAGHMSVLPAADAPSPSLLAPSLHTHPYRRRDLGMVQDKPAILLVGGGEGMGPVEKTVDGVAQVWLAAALMC